MQSRRKPLPGAPAVDVSPPIACHGGTRGSIVRRGIGVCRNSMVNAGRQRFILVWHTGKSRRPTSSLVWIVYCALRYLLCCKVYCGCEFCRLCVCRCVCSLCAGLFCLSCRSRDSCPPLYSPGEAGVLVGYKVEILIGLYVTSPNRITCRES